jgi:hypothetical protein
MPAFSVGRQLKVGSVLILIDECLTDSIGSLRAYFLSLPSFLDNFAYRRFKAESVSQPMKPMVLSAFFRFDVLKRWRLLTSPL